jgi:translation initiation factor 2 alpha subunit (eIF-2alpha)
MEAAKMKLEIKYIAAPEYMVIYRTKQAKKGESEFMEKLEKLTKSAGCICEIEK